MKSEYHLMKRTYSDGQFTVERKSEQLIEVKIEGPLGKRAGTALVDWLYELAETNYHPQFVLLDASNVGFVIDEAQQQIADIIRDEKIGGMAIYGDSTGQARLATLLDYLDDHLPARFFSRIDDGVLYLNRLNGD
jgi:hypothetical protein